MAVSATILGCSGPRLTADEKRFFAEVDPWGFILFGRNVETPDQLRALCADLRTALGRDAPILIDQEGGRVQRLRSPHWQEFPPALDQITALPPADIARAMWLRGRLIAHDLAEMGIDVNCAPNLDLVTPQTHDFLKNRCYGSDPEPVARAARALVDGMAHGGVLAVMKHMPGHGRAGLDTHHDLARVSAGRDDLYRHDFAPFAALNDLPMAMTAHIVFEAIDATAPATCSARMIDIIRQDIGFQGLLMTDDISMQALTGSLGVRSAAAISAGCDVVLHCNGVKLEMAEVAAAAGPLGAAAQTRAAAALAARTAPQPVDIKALRAEFEAMLHGQGNG